MPLTTTAKNQALDAILRGVVPPNPVTHVGAFTSQTGKAVTATTGGVFTSTAHGFAAGDLVVFSGLTGGTGLRAGYPYFVIATNLAANTFSVSDVPGGGIVTMTSALTAGTVNRLVELSGGSPAYARKAIAFAAAASGLGDDSTNGAIIDVPGGTSVDWLGLFSAVTAGVLVALDQVTTETFAAQGTYTVTDAKVDAMLADA